MFDPPFFALLLVPRELVRVNKLFDRQVHARRLQILPDGHDVQANGREVIHKCKHLFVDLAQSDHDSAFRAQALSLRPAEHLEGSPVFGLGPHFPVEAWHSLDVMIENVGPFVEHDLECVPETTEIRNQHLDGTPRGRFTNEPDSIGEYRSAAVFAFVAVYAGNDGVLDAHLLHSVGYAAGFVVVEPFVGPSR